MLISFMPHFCVSPGLIAGSGLKRGLGWRFGGVIVVSPGLIAGSGLKHIPDKHHIGVKSVSPGLIAGSGLKRRTTALINRSIPYLPA